mmetsp:Transcript_6876/g.17325  ORF Transcript_6876/g.17325 Transcript_6876/m.17325 type:complete len:364 (-) Transcript_6876:119-1210(-)|eukprot:CAMPEP_0177628606 /NCGR_PEP_ID=MMETSP0447-20121125/220_1 /TAXON_ID=0 /ORGANISM="Stygamoeba regulata, Strain BSH-02190019" /LENGTH=363 /DNA_ID=CAMNT_0019129863 /DNA_START=99 /DNA_END=1190 /DNA_ORIENTATION=+
MYQQVYDTKCKFYKDVDGSTVAAATVQSNPNLYTTGPRVSCLVSPSPTDEELRLICQMGVTHVFSWVNAENANLQFLKQLKQKTEDYGLVLYNVGCRELGKSPDVILGTEKRDSVLDQFQKFLEDLSAIGVFTTTFTWEPDGVWTTSTATTRGGASARAVDASLLPTDPPGGRRAYEDEELWDNIRYFLSRMLPVCARTSVRLALHPNDPPVKAIAGVPCLIRNAAAYERVFQVGREVAPQDCQQFLGMEFCCGCWLEGGAHGFGPLLHWLHKFATEGRVFIVHLRNVSSPLPVFAETFIDGGYGHVTSILRVLVDAGYGGTVILDHTPQFTDCAGPAAASCFSIGYIKGCLAACIRKEAKRE